MSACGTPAGRLVVAPARPGYTPRMASVSSRDHAAAREPARASTPARVEPTPGARVLVVHPGALGDFVQALPAMAALRATWPHSTLLVATGPDLAPLARDLGVADEIIVYDVAAAWRGRPRQRAAALTALVRDVRRARCTHAVLFKASPVYAAVAWAAGVPTRVGFARAGSGASDRLTRRLLTHRVPFTAGRHREDRFADLVRAAGAEPAPPSAARASALPWPGTAHALSAVPAGATLVGIAPGGARNAKEDMAPRRWPAERFAELARRLAGVDPAVHVILLGGPGDVAEGQAVRAALPGDRFTDLVARTSVADARAVIGRLAVFVGNDSGLLHLAATTPTPAVAVFGPSDPREACPRRAGVRSLWEPARAEACLDDVTGRLRGCVTPCCIERVSVDAVAHAARAALAACRPSGATA